MKHLGSDELPCLELISRARLGVEPQSSLLCLLVAALTQPSSLSCWTFLPTWSAASSEVREVLHFVNLLVPAEPVTLRVMEMGAQDYLAGRVIS